MFGATSFSAASFGAGPATGPIGVSGLAATGGVGSASINGDADAVVTGLQATSGFGQVLFSIGVNVTGVGATGGVGTAIPSLPENVSVTGVSATMPMTATGAGGGFFGGVGFAEESFATPADTALKVSFELGTGGLVTGVAAAGDVGSVTVVGPANVSVTGVAATGGVGSVAVVAAGQVEVTGLAGTGGVGAVTVTEGAGINVAVGSVSAQGQVGVASATGAISVLVTGVAATGATSGASVVAWNEIVPNQDPNWTEIAA